MSKNHRENILIRTILTNVTYVSMKKLMAFMIYFVFVYAVRVVLAQKKVNFTVIPKQPTLCKKASNHNANLPLEMYSFTL